MKDLLTWYGLKRHPFTKEIKTSELVETASIQECNARLEYMKRRGGIMLLTGDPGVGKTVSLRRLVDNLNDNLFKPVYTPLTTLKGADLLRHINDKLGLPNRAAKSAIYRQVQQEILDTKEHRGQTIVFIIDEAHLLQPLSLQELRLLTNFRMDSFDPFILILSGQSELRQKMDLSSMEPLAQRLSMRYHMLGLSPDEVADYLNHHMNLAGSTEPIFTNDALVAINEVSFGIPRKIGLIAELALTYAMFDEKRTVDADVVLQVKKPGT